MLFPCSKRTCAFVRAHYLHPERREDFVRALMRTYDMSEKKARHTAADMARRLRLMTVKEPASRAE